MSTSVSIEYVHILYIYHQYLEPEEHMERKWIAAIAVIVVIVVIGGSYAALKLGGNGNGTTPQSTAKVTITETGSTLLEPVFDSYAGNYTTAKISPSGGGSGQGISYAAKGTDMIGGSDAFLLPAQTSEYPYLLNIPVMISYQYVAYNLPGLNNVHLNLSGQIIAEIYSGTITSWNDSQIQAANPGTSLPNKTIVPIHRLDGSGDTFMFTSFLSKSSTAWKNGTATSVTWPNVPGGLAETANSGIINTMKATPYSIGYIAATYSSTIKLDSFGTAYLEDHNSGQYVGPTVANVSNAASHYLSSIPSNGTVALQYAPGTNSYPLADMEYVMVKQNQSAYKSFNSSQIASSIQAFLNWIVNSTSGGSQTKYLEQFNLVALPTSVVNGITVPLINKIHG